MAPHSKRALSDEKSGAPVGNRASDTADDALDRELARMDERPGRSRPDADDGMGSYVKSYARSVLPFALGLGAFRALQGGSVVAVVSAVIGGTLLAGFVSFVFRTLLGASRRSDAVRAKREAEANAARSRPIEKNQDAGLDARLDDELEKLD